MVFAALLVIGVGGGIVPRAILGPGPSGAWRQYKTLLAFCEPDFESSHSQHHQTKRPHPKNG